MSKKLYDELKLALRHFNLPELKQHAINQIADLNWDDVLNSYENVKAHNRENIINVIIEEIKQLELEVDNLEEIIQNLNLLAIGISKTKTWQTYKISDQDRKVPTTTSEIITKLERRFRASNIQTEIYAIDHDGKFIIRITTIASPGKKSTRTTTATPFFIIYPPSANYIFSTKVLASENFNTLLVRGLGFKKIERIKLVGKNTDELLKFLLIKENKRSRIAYKEPEYNPKVKILPDEIDFTRTKEKLDYANEIYDEDVCLHTTTFSIRNKPCVSNHLKGESMNATITFMSPNMSNMMKNFIAAGVIQTPLPDYLKECFNKGKNQFNIGWQED